MLNFPKLPLDHLLGLDMPLEDPSEHAVFGFADACALELQGRSGPGQRLGPCALVGVHRSDEQSQAAAGSLDLEFGVDGIDYVVDLEVFVQKRLVEVAQGWGTVVLALCNPDCVDLAPLLGPLGQVIGGELYWPYGDVQAGYASKEGPRILEAQRWFRM